MKLKRTIGFLISLAILISKFSNIFAGEMTIDNDYVIAELEENVVSSLAVEIKEYNNYNNILKNGYVCCDEKYTYYINFNDNSYLYKTDGISNEIIYSEYVRNLFIDSGYLYFIESDFDTSKILKMDLSTNLTQTIVSVPGIEGIMDMYIVNDYIYYKSNNKIMRYNNGKNEIVFENGNQIFNYIIKENVIYYNDYDENKNSQKLKTYNIGTGEERLLSDNVKDFAVTDNSIYYVDIYNNLYKNNDILRENLTDYIISENENLYFIDKENYEIYELKADESIILYNENEDRRFFNIINGQIIFTEIIEENDFCIDFTNNESSNEGFSLLSITGEYENWKQGDPRWASKSLNGAGTMASIGCAVTSLAISVVHAGMREESQFDPGKLCDFLNNNGGFTSGGALYWGTVSKMIDGFTLYNSNISINGTNANKANQIARYSEEGYAVLIQVQNGGHWVACNSVSGNTVYIMDPGYSGRTNLFSSYSGNGVNRIVVYNADTYKSTIQNDTQLPTISNWGVKDITKDGYTAYCTVTDDIGVTNVQFPTWYTSNQAGTIKWLNYTNKSGNYYECVIKISDFGNKEGNYSTHIYAMDGAHPTASQGSGIPMNSIYIDNTSPVISNVKVSKNTTGYTVSCMVTDNNKVNRVQFPTWTSLNGQDDIQSNWQNNSDASGMKRGNIYTYTVKYSDHNNEQGTYNTHIYAYDIHGNSSAVPATVGNYYKYTIAYNANGGSGAPNSQTKVNDIDIVLSNTVPNKTGYSFDGWATSIGASTAQYQPGNIYSLNANVTLYAVWKKTSTTTEYIKGDLNGDGNISISDLSKMMKAIVGLVNLDSKQFYAADLNGDGQISISDLSRLKKYLVGLRATP